MSKIHKSDIEWRAQLTSEQYRVIRQGATERAFSSPTWNSHRHGHYRCACCGRLLFASEAKFDAGVGWPNFVAPEDNDALTEHRDRSFIIPRTRVQCSDCGAHIGHVFNDGPLPTGRRYCVNGISLTFEELRSTPGATPPSVG